MKLVRYLTAVTLLVAMPLQATAQADLRPFDAEYRVKMSGARGHMTMSVKPDGVNLLAVSRIEPRGFARLFARGSITETARFAVRGGRLEPLDYSSEDTIKSDTERTTMTFDRPLRQARGEDEDGAFSHPLDDGAYDRLSIQYALMLDLTDDGELGQYTMLDGHKLKELDVENLGIETVRVPYGEFDAIKVTHRARDSSRQTTLWCVPQFGHLPVMIEQRKGDKLVVRAQMTEHRFVGNASESPLQ